MESKIIKVIIVIYVGKTFISKMSDKYLYLRKVSPKTMSSFGGLPNVITFND